MTEKANQEYSETQDSIKEIIKTATINNISMIDSNEPVAPEQFILTVTDSTPKAIIGFKTNTFLDSLFLDDELKPLGGVPIVGQYGIVGLSGVGKSLLAQEAALQSANKGVKTALITSEDTWETNNERDDLKSRMQKKAAKLGLDWNTIKQNLFVLDAITYTELRSWRSFILVYNTLIETKEIKMVIIDSITMLESYRSALKNRVAQLAQYNQVHGITALYICQRSDEETDKFAIAGNIGVAHNLDSVICIDFAKAMGQLKEQLGVKQWEMVHFCRVLSCRLAGFDRSYHEMEITPQGLLMMKTINPTDEQVKK